MLLDEPTVRGAVLIKSGRQKSVEFADQEWYSEYAG